MLWPTKDTTFLLFKFLMSFSHDCEELERGFSIKIPFTCSEILIAESM